MVEALPPTPAYRYLSMDRMRRGSRSLAFPKICLFGIKPLRQYDLASTKERAKAPSDPSLKPPLEAARATSGQIKAVTNLS